MKLCKVLSTHESVLPKFSPVLITRLLSQCAAARAGPGLCLGPVSPGVPGPGPGYHNSQLRFWQNENCRDIQWYTSDTGGAGADQWGPIQWSNSVLKVAKVGRLRSVPVLCKKVMFWTARAGRIPSIVIIFTFVILIQFTFNLCFFFVLRKWIGLQCFGWRCFCSFI